MTSGVYRDLDNRDTDDLIVYYEAAVQALRERIEAYRNVLKENAIEDPYKEGL